MCDHENREAAMVVLDPGTPERNGRDGVWCDPCLAPLVKALNDGGLPTVASCCGHGGRPGFVSLADGRELFIAIPEQAEAIHQLSHDRQLAAAPEYAADYAQRLPAQSLKADAALYMLERLVCLLEQGDYVPYGLIVEARELVDAYVNPPEQG